jgi:hypothetical protein
MTNPIEELQQYEQTIGEHIGKLKAYAEAAKKADLHFLPHLQEADGSSQIVVHIVNFEPKNGAAGTTVMEGVPAAFLYEAYREHLDAILAAAVKKAEASLGEKAKLLKGAIEQQKKDLAEASKELDKYLKARSPTTKKGKTVDRSFSIGD